MTLNTGIAERLGLTGVISRVEWFGSEGTAGKVRKKSYHQKRDKLERLLTIYYQGMMTAVLIGCCLYGRSQATF